MEVLSQSQDLVLSTLMSTNTIAFFLSNEYKNNIVS
jgi:hypothetical protein